MDFIYLAYGLAFFLLAVVCRVLGKSSMGSLLPWGWLSAFGFLHSIYEWLHILDYSMGESAALLAIRLFFLGTSFLALVAFAFAASRPSLPRRARFWIFPGLILAALSGAALGPECLQNTLRHALGLVGALWTAQVFWTTGRRGPRGRSPCLLGVGALMAAYAIAAGAIGPKVLFFPASHIHTEGFLAWTGLPIQAIRGLLAFVVAAALWHFYYKICCEELTLISREERQWRWVYPLLLFVLLGGGWSLTEYLGHREEVEERQTLIEYTAAIAVMLDPEIHKKFQGDPTDHSLPEFIAMKEQLRRIQRVNPKVLWFYTMILREGQAAFIVDSSPDTDAVHHAESGVIYDDAPPELFPVFSNGQNAVVGPYTDKYGTFVSGFGLVPDPEPGSPAVALGVDMDATSWVSHIAFIRLPGLVVTLLAILSFTHIFASRLRTLRANAAMAASEHRYRTLVDGSPNGVLLLDSHGRLLGINASGLKLFGRTEEDLKTRPLADFLPPESRDIMNRGFAKALNGQCNTWEISYRRPADESDLHWQATLTPTREPDGTIRQIMGVIVDITARKRAEAALRESEQRLLGIFDFLPDATFAIDRAGRVIAWNRAIEEMTGILKRDILGKGDYLYSAPFYGMPRPILIDTVLQKLPETERKYDYLMHRESRVTAEAYTPAVYGGKGAHLWGIASALYDTSGRLFGAIECIRDITDRKEAVEALRLSEERFRTFFELPLVGFAITTPGGTWVHFNDKLCDILGYTREELPKLTWEALTPADILEKELPLYKGVLDGKPPGMDIEKQYFRKDGARVDVRLASRCIRNKDGSVAFFASIVEDITQSKRDRARLDKRLRYEQGVGECSRRLLSKRNRKRGLEAALQALLESTGASRTYIFENHEDPELGLCAIQACEACAPGVESQIHTPALQNMPYAPIAPRWRAELSENRTIQGCVEAFPEEERAVLEPQGILSLLVLPIFVAGRWLGFIGFDDTVKRRTWDAEDVRLLRLAAEIIGHFIARAQAEEQLWQAHHELEAHVLERTTELRAVNARLTGEMIGREKTSKALAESERKYREMVDYLPLIIFELDLQGRVTFINQAAYALCGYTMEDVAKGFFIADAIDPRDRARLKTNFELLLRGERRSDKEYNLLRKDGSLMPIFAYSHVVTENGRPTGITGFLMDISAHKRAEEVLRRAQTELETRVTERTAKLAETNESLKSLLRKQEVNIKLAREALNLIDANPPRHTDLDGRVSLFFASIHIPCHIEGGDHFFVRNWAAAHGRNARTIASLKDQSGHEVGCILRSIVTDMIHQSILREFEGAPLEEVTLKLHNEIRRSKLFEDDDFFTAIGAELDHRTLRLRYLALAHPPLILIRDGRAVRLPGENEPGGNLPTGLTSGTPLSAGERQLEVGDRMLFYTDGLLDIPRSKGAKGLSSEALCGLVQTIVSASPGLAVGAIMEEVFIRLTGLPPGRQPRGAFVDDVALLGLEIEERGEAIETILRPRDRHDFTRLSRELFERIRAEWDARGFEDPDFRLRMSLEEALINAWHHGNHESPEKSIAVRREYGNDARIDILDEGAGFDFRSTSDPTAYENRTKLSGRGLFVIRRFTEEVSWGRNGAQVTLYFGRRPKPATTA